MNKIYNIIRYKLRYGSTVEWFNFLYVVLRKKQKIIPEVISIDNTIKKIVKDKCSVSRFGDGEMLLMGNKPIRFQKWSEELSKRLQEVISSNNQNHLVCISDTFTNLFRFNRKARRFWRTHFFLSGDLWDKYLTPGRSYYNTFMTRPYMDYKSKENTGHWFDMLKTIWEGRDIIFIEGDKSRLGVGNDLFINASSIRRILCPPTNAFERYDEIFGKALEQDKGVLFLIALGPTATVLAYDLFLKGYQAIDVGHVDIEYEWYRMKAKRKIKIPSKYVNEAPNGNIVTENVGEDYDKQVIARIK